MDGSLDIVFLLILLASEAVNVMLHIGWPLAAPVLLVLLCIAMLIDFSRDELRRASVVRSLLPLLAVVLMLACGVIFRGSPKYFFLPYACVGLCFVLCVVSVIRLRRMWSTALMVSIWIFWYSLGCAFMTIMSIKDDWL